MVAPTSRKQRKAATRRSLLEAGQRCLARRGYVDTQISDIAREAGVAHGTFYVHFKSKEALLEQLLAEFNDGLVQRLSTLDMAGIAESNDRLEQLVQQMAHEFLGYWAEHRDFVRAVAQKTALGTSVESLRDGINPQTVRFLMAALTRLGTAAGAPLPDAELITHGLLALWMRVGLQALFNDSVALEQAERTLTALTVGALRRAMTVTAGSDGRQT